MVQPQDASFEAQIQRIEAEHAVEGQHAVTSEDEKTEFPLYTKENSLILCQQLAHVLVIRVNKLLHQVHMPCSFSSRMLLRVSETKALSPRARLEGISHVSCNPAPSPYVSSDNRKNHWNRITLTFPGYDGCEGAWRVVSL